MYDPDQNTDEVEKSKCVAHALDDWARFAPIVQEQLTELSIRMEWPLWHPTPTSWLQELDLHRNLLASALKFQVVPDIREQIALLAGMLIKANAMFATDPKSSDLKI